MDPIRTGKHLDQLRLRRNQVALTLLHIEKDRREAERNTDWLDQASYESRMALLDSLNNNTYGFCLACHRPIEALRLDSFPEAAFCSACQETRDGLQNS